MKRVSKNKSNLRWPDLIQLAEEKLKRISLKTGQLKAILAMFSRQADLGEPCQTDIVLLGNDLSMLLH